jgi:hypothetical protein
MDLPVHLLPYKFKATLYSMLYFKVDDVGALEAISKPPERIVEDNVTASLH